MRRLLALLLSLLAAPAVAQVVPRGTTAAPSTALNVKNFGAKCDSVTDDGAALQAAIASAIANTTGAHVGGANLFVPAGTCNFSVTLDITKPLLIYGVPGNVSTLHYTGTGTAIIWEHGVLNAGCGGVCGSTLQYPYGSGIRDIWLLGPGPGAGIGQTVGLLCGNTNSTANTQGAAFWNLHISEFRIGFKGSNGCNLFSAINNDYSDDSIALYLPSGTTVSGEGLTWEHSTFANCARAGTGVVIGNGWEVQFSRSSFDACGVLDSSTTNVTCIGCHFENPGALLNYDELTVQNGSYVCTSCTFSNSGDPAATDSQFVQVNGTNAIFASFMSSFSNPAGSSPLPSRAVEVSLGKKVVLVGDILNTASLVREWALGSAQATFGVESFGSLNPGVPFAEASTVGLPTNLTYSASINVDNTRGNFFTLTATNGTAFTINIPARPPNGGTTQVITFDIFNNSGGALGAVTFPGGGNGYRLAGAWVSPATGFHRTISFQFNQISGNWNEISRAAADIAN